MSELFLIYGASATAKTTACAQFHRYESTRLQVSGLHVTLDSSFEPLDEEIRDGRVRVWHIGYERPEINSSLLNAIHALAAGFMPSHLDPVTGARMSHSFEAIRGAVSVEGLYMITDQMVRYIAAERGLQNVSFQEASGANVGSAHQSVYSLVKQQTLGAITRMKGLRDVQRILWTSHEGTGTDLMDAEVLGPAMVPAKGLDKIPGYFAHYLRAESLQFINETGQPEIGKLLHFIPHKHTTSSLLWPAKVSLSPQRSWFLSEFARLKSRGVFPGALFNRIEQGVLTGGISDLLRFLDTNNLSIEELKQKLLK